MDFLKGLFDNVASDAEITAALYLSVFALFVLSMYAMSKATEYKPPKDMPTFEGDLPEEEPRDEEPARQPYYVFQSQRDPEDEPKHPPHNHKGKNKVVRGRKPKVRK